MKPIAILLATYNGERFLEEMLTSLENQTYQNFICYIHDDGSSDGTLEIIKEWTAKLPQRYVFLEGTSQGSAKANFLWMLEQVEAEYYMFADQDDVWLPNKVQLSKARIDDLKTKVEGPACVFTDMYVVDESLQVMDESFIRYIGRAPERTSLSQVLIDNPAAGCTMIFDKMLRDMALQLQDQEQIEMHDIWVLALAACFGEEHVGVLDEPLVYYRQHGNNEMGAHRESVFQKVWRNASGIVSGSMAREKKEFIQQSRDLAKQLSLVDGIPEEQRFFLQEFSEIGKKKKKSRIDFYKSNQISRLHGTKWMYFWV